MTQTFYVAAHAGVALMYFAVTWRVWLLLQKSSERVSAARGGLVLGGGADWPVACALLLHALVLSWGVFGHGGMRFGFAPALSMVLLLANAALWIEGFFVPMRGLQVLVLPMAGVCALLPAVFPGAAVGYGEHAQALRAHLWVAMLAYSLLTVAAVHALLMAAIDRQLHLAALGRDTPWQRVFRQAPPLLTMENQLFRLLGLGFVLLTVTLISGIFFSEAVYGQAMRLDHKTVFAWASWVIFGGLVLGRLAFGWRGRVALRWTLIGFGLLLLAYVGAHFVLEVLLHRV
ncbi:MAG TPA: cytochrome c biogenesis protein CcsA [Burkholderiaceae bacterium]|nr:cytochrome c biogenesis protein CcsA [Burkholderiaceae bacterium]